MTNADIAVNGRFLTQNLTGVQRYAHSVLAEMDLLFDREPVAVLCPKETSTPHYQNFHVRSVGAANGHLWEQVSLPCLSRGKRLLNLCNTAPVTKSDQIVCIHDSNVFTAPDSYTIAFRSIYKAMQPTIASRSARITTVSHAAARQLARHLPLNLADIAVLPNGHEHALYWDANKATVGQRIWKEPSSRRPYVLALGSNARHKNLALLSQIAADLDAMGLDIVIAGGGNAIFTSQMLAVAPNIRVTGRVSDDDLAYLLDEALCLVFPSLTEGFGLPIIEAMARRCPVISSNCASMPEICGDAAVLLSPTDPQTWIEAIRRLMSSDEMKDELIGRADEQVKQFSWKTTAAAYKELLLKPDSKVIPHTSSKSNGTCRVTVIFATRGRPEVISAVARHLLENQTQKPESVIISCCDMADAGDLVNEQAVSVIVGPPGLAAQRNTALSQVPVGTEMVVFFDDDFIAGNNWLESALQIFRDDVEVAGLTGNVIADGIKGPGIPFQDALELVRDGRARSEWISSYSPYGCNMAFRFSAVGNLRFDERLVLYGWLEDRDFGAALAKKGVRLAKSSAMYGVHMGTKSGRVSGQRLGYSQIINPIYMARKGTMTVDQVAGQIFRNLASNLTRSVWPESFIDRKGRLAGNFVGLTHALRGILEPERAATNGFVKPPKPQSREREEVVNV